MIKDFSEIRGYMNFCRGAHRLLITTLSEFFSAEVKLQFKPARDLRYHNIDITLFPKRNVYYIDSNSVILVCNAIYKGDSYYLGIVLEGNHIGELKKIFNLMADTISDCLNKYVCDHFQNAISFVGDSLILRLIAKQLGKQHYSAAKVFHMVEKFISLRSTTFEGKHFSTGLLLTQSFHDYKKNGKEGRNGVLLSLNRPKDFLARIDNRFWYLADGFRIFYITDLKSDIRNMFVYNGDERDYIKNMVLYSTLKGGDAMIRTEGGREVSIISSNGVEFVNQENTWRYRDYGLLKKRILKEMAMADEVYNSLLYYVLFCSKNDISSLIWVPKDLASYKEALKPGTINKLARTNIRITDQRYSTLIKRILSSDGATVISGSGEIEAFGCMVDTSGANPTGVKGTGETAAGMLAKNGFAIKVSQDGTIKVCLNGRNKPIKF